MSRNTGYTINGSDGGHDDHDSLIYDKISYRKA